MFRFLKEQYTSEGGELLVLTERENNTPGRSCGRRNMKVSFSRESARPITLDFQVRISVNGQLFPFDGCIEVPEDLGVPSH